MNVCFLVTYKKQIPTQEVQFSYSVNSFGTFG